MCVVAGFLFLTVGNMTEPLAYSIQQLTAILPLSRKQLYNAIHKTDRTTGVLEIAGVSIPIHKQGVRWLVWRADIDAMRPAVEKPKQQQRAKKVRRVAVSTPVFQFVKD